MRKINFLLVLSLLVAAPAFALDDTSLGNVLRLRGTGAKQADAVRLLKLVRYVSRDANASGIVSGDALSYSTISDDGVSVIESPNSADGAFAGVAAMTIQTADGTSTTAYDDTGRRNWGWIVVNGLTTVNISAGGTNGHAAGDAFITSKDEGTVTTFEGPAGTDASRGELRKSVGIGGWFTDAVSASDTTAEVYVENV